MPESGGAIFASNANVNLQGGTIKENAAVYGGGIFAVYDSVVTITDGLIANNKAIYGSNPAYSGYSGTGGGVCAWRGAAVNFSGGTITNNTAFNRGGGISLGSTVVFYGDKSSVLTMTGGTISNNEAGCAGGGLFVSSGLSAKGGGGTPSYSIATITSGSFLNNKMTGEGDSNKSFGGGAIYVNGISSSYDTFHNGELYVTKANISNNHATIAGGGFAGCPVSDTKIYLTKGAAIFNNTTDGDNAKEIYILASNYYGAHSGNPHYKISEKMLGGGVYNWKFDDGSEVPLEKLEGYLNANIGESLSLNNDLTAASESVQKALSITQVTFTGNDSVTRGGAIGSNGSVVIGKEPNPATTTITVKKIWEDANNDKNLRPESIEVKLYGDGGYISSQTIKPDENGDWITTFENLAKYDAVDEHEINYTVEEIAVSGYESSIEGSMADGFVITNKVVDTPITPEEPAKPQKPTQIIPQTGDNMAFIINALMTISGIFIATLLTALTLQKKNLANNHKNS